ncbi:MAG: M48 family metallopeptidase [Candidatus Omnitrophica bacterium]|nr:M48 family metallopeptidase [Candidatus Omnitrophota bacterium]
MTNASEDRNKAYQRQRNWLTLYGLLLSLAILTVAIVFRLTFLFHDRASQITSSSFGIVFFYFLFFSIYSLVLSLPLSFYSGFILEHRYELSNQSFLSWLWEHAKKELLSFGIAAVLVLLLYALIWNFETNWWFLAWIGYAVFSLVLGKLFPVLIVPLFYKYSPIADEVLRKRIEVLADQFGVKIQNVYSLNLSKTTKKANAAFTGFGKTKRVILGDTLLNSFNHDEIETVLAHELGHYKHHDIWKQFGFGILLSFIGFWLAAQALDAFSGPLGYLGAGDVRSFPLLCLVFFIFSLVISPAGNAFSRFAERKADQFALDVTKDTKSFISAMQKLSNTNLADPNPHPLIEFFLYDHPAIGKRIQVAEHYGTS